jgi:hypothetical protein
MAGKAEPLFDLLVRDFARGGSRRDFVRRSTGLAAVFGLSRAGMPARWMRPVAILFGMPAPCESDRDCRPCQKCEVQKLADPPTKVCVFQCQAQCSKCSESTGQCIDTCPTCKVCYPTMYQVGGTCESIEEIMRCKKCDPATGKLSDGCSACEKCEKGECISNCPNKCEVCDNGACRKCGESGCDQCDETTGRCYGCDPKCETCNGATKQCESTCPRGLACCAGKCLNCCGGCNGDDCANFGDAACPAGAKTPACCGGLCYDLDSSNPNCGACDNWCRTSLQEWCVDGKCVCRGVSDPLGVALFVGGGMECREKNHECCDGNCVDMASYQTDPKHCGKCIVQCEKDQRCVKGECVGSKRAGYRISYRMRATSENFGVEMEVGLQATVRTLRVPDAEGNTLAGWGTYEGYIKNRKINCANNAPMDWETIPLVGRARGKASRTPAGGGKTFMTFVITPLDPPKMHLFTRSFRGIEGAAGLKEEDLPDAVLPVLGPLTLRGGRGKDSKSFKMPGDSCGGTMTHDAEWEATRIE